MVLIIVAFVDGGFPEQVACRFHLLDECDLLFTCRCEYLSVICNAFF